MFSAIISAGMMTVTSCGDYKDDLRDLQTQIDNHTKIIEALQTNVSGIESTIKDLQERLDKIKSCECDINNALTEDDVKNIIDNYITIKNLQESITILQNALDNYYTKKEIDEKILLINNAISEVTSRVDGIDLKLIDINDDLTEIKTTADKALKQAEDNLEMIKKLQEALDNLDIPTGDTSDLEKRIKDLEDTLKDCYYTKTQVDELLAKTLDNANLYTDTEIGKLRNEIEDLLDPIKDDIQELKDKVKDLEDNVAQNTKDIKSTFFNQNHLITSIELQGSKNPAFGRYALPDGTSSNILIAYYGQTENPVKFPAIDDAGLVAACSDSKNWITADDYAVTGFTPVEYNGTLLGEGEGNAGKLYLTINPSSVDFTGANFKLVNSLGEEAPVKLGDIKPCTEKLAFGYGRATVSSNSSNGFYEATATLDESKIDQVKFVIDERLKDAVKSVYKNKLDANFSDLAVAIYNQFNGVIDAYGVQGEYKYKENDADGNPVEKTAKVTSRYDIAATAFKPLSYSANLGKLGKLPTITPFSEMNIDLKKFIDPKKFNFSVSDISVNISVDVDFSDIYVDNEGNIWSDITVTTPNETFEKTPVMIISKDEVASVGWNKEQAELLAKIIDDRASAWSAQLTQEFTQQFASKMADMQSKIQNAINSIGGKLESAVDDVLTNLNNALNSKLNSADKFVNQLNKLSNSINSRLNNLNALLQACIVYETEDGTFHSLSTSQSMPSVVTGSGAIALYATSMTGEIAVPAFQKYVAVTNIYKDGKNAHEDATLKSALQATNNTDNFMNVIFDGDQYAVVFEPSVSGAVYEIVYSALDYNGKISQRKYYVKVN